MAAWRYEISLLVLKKLHLFAAYFSTLKEKFHISARSCNILYILLICLTIIKLFVDMVKVDDKNLAVQQ